jgi:hypothetical protein
MKVTKFITKDNKNIEIRPTELHNGCDRILLTDE